MVCSSFNLRLQHLKDNIKQDLALLKKYEDALRYEDDPRPNAKYGCGFQYICTFNSDMIPRSEFAADFESHFMLLI